MRRPLLALPLLALLVLAHPSSAASRGDLLLKDISGDANGVNSQALGLMDTSVSTNPASLKSMDILGLDVRTSWLGSGANRRANGFTVTMRLAGTVQEGVLYGVTADVNVPCGGSSRLQLGYQDLRALSTNLAICQSEETNGDSTDLGGGALGADGRSVVWTVNAFGKPGKVSLSNFAASSTVFVVGVYDELLSVDRSWTYGR